MISLAERKRGRQKTTGDVYTADCPSRGILDHITSRWGCLILTLLLERTYRFSELAHHIGGVSERMLAHSLHVLEADGFVLRTVYPTKPPKVEYSLTALGHELAPRLQSLTVWVEQNVPRILAQQTAHGTAKAAACKPGSSRS